MKLLLQQPGANAVFTFSRNFLQSDIGFWNWTIWYLIKMMEMRILELIVLNVQRWLIPVILLYMMKYSAATRDSGEQIAPADTIQFTGSISLRNGVPFQFQYEIIML